MLHNKKLSIVLTSTLLLAASIYCAGCGKTAENETNGSESAVQASEETTDEIQEDDLSNAQETNREIEANDGNEETEQLGDEWKVKYMDISCPIHYTTISKHNVLKKREVWHGDKARVKTIHHEEGEEVKKGEPLITLTIDMDHAGIRECELQAKNANEALERARKQHNETIAELQSKMAMASYQDEKDELGLEIQIADESFKQVMLEHDYQIEKINERRQSLTKKTGEITITAKIDGKISKIIACEEGRSIQDGEELVVVESTENTLFRIPNVTDIPFNAEVRIVNKTSDNNIKETTGTVVASGNAVSDEVSQKDLYIDVKDKSIVDELNRSYVEYGYYSAEHVLAVPRDGVYDLETNKPYVYVIQDGVKCKREIIINKYGREQMPYIWILDGLEEGEIVSLR